MTKSIEILNEKIKTKFFSENKIKDLIEYQTLIWDEFSKTATKLDNKLYRETYQDLKYIKKYKEEILPTLKTLNFEKFLDNLLIFDDNDSVYDATLYIGNEKKHIQCTMAVDGEMIKIISNELYKNGYAPGYFKDITQIKASYYNKEKKIPDFNNDYTIFNQTDYKQCDKNHIEEIISVIDKKNKKSYPKNFWLIVASFRTNGTNRNHSEISSEIKAKVNKMITNFDRIYLVYLYEKFDSPEQEVVRLK